MVPREGIEPSSVPYQGTILAVETNGANGAAKRIQTSDPRTTNAVLYQLSYSSIYFGVIYSGLMARVGKRTAKILKSGETQAKRLPHIQTTISWLGLYSAPVKEFKSLCRAETFFGG
jgi:hypothetical protein